MDVMLRLSKTQSRHRQPPLQKKTGKKKNKCAQLSDGEVDTSRIKVNKKIGEKNKSKKTLRDMGEQ